MCNNDRKTNKLVAHHQYDYLKFKISQTFFIFEGKLIFFLGEYLPTLTVKSQNGRVTLQVTYIYYIYIYKTNSIFLHSIEKSQHLTTKKYESND